MWRLRQASVKNRLDLRPVTGCPQPQAHDTLPIRLPSAAQGLGQLTPYRCAG